MEFFSVPKMEVTMVSHRSKLLQITALFLWRILLSSSQTIHPECQGMCGDVNIPYPFGTSPNCFLNPDFKVFCNETLNPPLLYLQESNMEVTNISLDGSLTVLQYVARKCYLKVGMVGESFGVAFDSVSKFLVSNTENKITAVGCDTTGMIMGFIGDERYTPGCMASCNIINDVVNGSCAGIGCCQTSIPNGLKNFSFNFQSTFNHINVWDFNPCSYVFVADKDAFNFSSDYLLNLKNTEKLPLVLDWTIGIESCQSARSSGRSYVCMENSDCFDVANGSGYLCKCKEGFEGNPYLHNGCIDVDECARSDLNHCRYGCVNTVGNYTCPCPKGQRGDGRIGGEGCVVDQTLLIVSVGLCGGIGMLLLVLGIFWLNKFVKKRNIINLKKKYFKRNGGLLLEQQILSDKGKLERSEIFVSEQLEKATDNFNENRVLGKGGQGTVYKAMLIDGSIVAVKKSVKIDEDESQIKQFVNEVVILSQINHKNVVKLLGCCLETEVPLLVYEFISNGTLSSHIHDSKDGFSIKWVDRLRIAREVAEALAYMHSSASMPIYHRDIKSSNILLDEKFVAKVSDFGISRSVQSEKTHFTTAVQGTFGYLDPEYFQTNQFTDKSDVYSYGVVLVELLTARKPVPTKITEGERGLAADFMSSIKEKRVFDLLDPQVVAEGDKEELILVANLAARCLKMNGKKRPTMREVARALANLKTSLNLTPIEEVTEKEDDDDDWELRNSDTSSNHSSEMSEKTLLENYTTRTEIFRVKSRREINFLRRIFSM